LDFRYELIVVPVSDVDRGVEVSEPDGNGWLIQEVRQRAPGR